MVLEFAKFCFLIVNIDCASINTILFISSNVVERCSLKIDCLIGCFERTIHCLRHAFIQWVFSIIYSFRFATLAFVSNQCSSNLKFSLMFLFVLEFVVGGQEK